MSDWTTHKCFVFHNYKTNLFKVTSAFTSTAQTNTEQGWLRQQQHLQLWLQPMQLTLAFPHVHHVWLNTRRKHLEQPIIKARDILCRNHALPFLLLTCIANLEYFAKHVRQFYASDCKWQVVVVSSTGVLQDNLTHSQQQNIWTKRWKTFYNFTQIFTSNTVELIDYQPPLVNMPDAVTNAF